MEKIFNESELPIEDLSFLQLYKNGKIGLEPRDLSALLNGRRTSLLSFENLENDKFRLKNIDAKLSLSRSPDGKITLMAHPVYKTPIPNKLLSDDELHKFQHGNMDNILKSYSDTNGNSKSWLIEYDPECREYVASDPDKISIPIELNGYTLDEPDREKFKNGKLLALPDGTIIQRRAANPDGLTSNRKSLMIKHLWEGTIVFELKENLENMYSSSSGQLEENSSSFRKALNEMKELTAIQPTNDKENELDIKNPDHWPSR